MTTPSLDQKKQLVADFLSRCNKYADEKLAAYQAQLAALSGVDALAVAEKISHWAAYRAFNEHAIRELETNILDSWFD